MVKRSNRELVRCFGNGPEEILYAKYHDEEWGKPSRDDHRLFEMLILEGAQAGLSWITVLKRREGYRRAFHNFDPKKVAKMDDVELETLMSNSEIIRNRKKIFSARSNAQVFLQIQSEYGSFSNYLWEFVQEEPVVHRCNTLEELPRAIPESLALSKDLQRRGMTFVGPTIIYAYMQAVGLIDDHLATCWRVKDSEQ